MDGNNQGFGYIGFRVLSDLLAAATDEKLLNGYTEERCARFHR